MYYTIVKLDLVGSRNSNARRSPLAARGIHVYDGQKHMEPLAERTAAAEACHAEAMGLRERLLARGLSVETIVEGGTPTFACHAKHPGVELSPGICFLQDGSYLEKFPDLDFEVAALLFTRVISVNRAGSPAQRVRRRRPRGRIDSPLSLPLFLIRGIAQRSIRQRAVFAEDA